MKCPSCLTGELRLSGSYNFCSKCSFSHFIVTADYIDSCIGVLVELSSNINYVDDNAFIQSTMTKMRQHVPQLHRWLTVDVHEEESAKVLATIVDRIKEQALNLVIDKEAFNEQEDKSLICECGSDEFNMKKVGLLSCNGCSAEYRYDEQVGIYRPVFQCSCGCVSVYKEEGDNSGLVRCAECGTPYMHNAMTNTYRRMV